MKKKFVLYNIFLPILFLFQGINNLIFMEIDIVFAFTFWMYMVYLSFFTFPFTILAYFIVIYILSKCFKVNFEKKNFLKLSIKSGIIGVVIDYIIIMIFIFLSEVARNQLGNFWDSFSIGIDFNPFTNIYVILSMFLIIFIVKYINYRINLKYCMNNIEIDEAKKKKLVLYTIILTAPYYFLIPTEWFV